MAVVVATHGRAALLPRLVDALEQQLDPPAFEVVLVDDGSPDDTWAQIEHLSRTATIAVRGVQMQRNSGPAAARNRGWRATTADLVLFTDDDCVPQPDWLRTLAGALSHTDIAQGRTIPAPDQRHMLGAFARTMEVTSETGYYQTCNVGYRRSMLEETGGFDDDLDQSGEDIELATRALARGARAVFRDDAVVHHDVRPSSLPAQLRATRRWGGIALAIRKQPQLRQRLHSGLWWKTSHPPALLAAAGVAIAVAGHGGKRWLGAAAVAPYVRHRLVTAPLPYTGPRRRVLLLPATLLADLTEVGVLARASARHHTLVL